MNLRKLSKPWRIALGAATTLFILLNAVAALHAYKFTHFSASPSATRFEDIQLTPIAKLKLLLTGVDNPRPKLTTMPNGNYQEVRVNSNVQLSCWYLPTPLPSKGTVLMFHGYTGCKSGLVPRAQPLLAAGYNCLLVDFMGTGTSEGNSTSIGYHEAVEVKDCMAYLQRKGERNLFLFGSSMGAVAIMKAMRDYKLTPKAIILECPFATMYQTVAIRFKMLHVPAFPMAALLVFWGGLENGFWGFAHNPVNYAPAIKCPVLLQYGARDNRVALNEVLRIQQAIGRNARLVVYPNSGHDDYLDTSGLEWTNNVTSFLNQDL